MFEYPALTSIQYNNSEYDSRFKACAYSQPTHHGVIFPDQNIVKLWQNKASFGAVAIFELRKSEVRRCEKLLGSQKFLEKTVVV